MIVTRRLLVFRHGPVGAPPVWVPFPETSPDGVFGLGESAPCRLTVDADGVQDETAREIAVDFLPQLRCQIGCHGFSGSGGGW
jgi:hypothetical protein